MTLHHDSALLSVEALVPRRRRPLVAVLPFAARNDDRLRLLGIETADLLRDCLATTPEVGSILISSDFLSRAPDHALELICRQLRVGYLVSGTCYQFAGADSLFIELADTRTWHVVWADFLKGRACDMLDAHGPTMRGVLDGLRDALRSHQQAW